MQRLIILTAVAIAISFVYCQTSCPSYWFEFNGYCYRYFTGLNGWRDAQDICVTYGANLASVHSDAENDFIHKLQGSCLDNMFWIGLNDEVVEGDMLWIDGTPLDYTNWNPGEPDNDLDQDCVAVAGSAAVSPWQWNDTWCLDTHHFVCKWKMP